MQIGINFWQVFSIGFLLLLISNFQVKYLPTIKIVWNRNCDKKQQKKKKKKWRKYKSKNNHENTSFHNSNKFNMYNIT